MPLKTAGGNMIRLTLASASKRRRELIKQIRGIDVSIAVPDVDESIVEKAFSNIYAMTLARLKAEAVFAACGGIVLSADTIVAVGSQILGKPACAAEAFEMFDLLCGREHEVVTGVCVKSQDKTVSAYQKSFVKFKSYDKNIIEDYIGRGNSFDKAGGYGIQDAEIQALVESVSGDVQSIIGLPLKTVEKILEEHFGWQRGI